MPTKLLAGLAMLADPKSASLMSPVSVTRMLPALISLEQQEFVIVLTVVERAGV